MIRIDKREYIHISDICKLISDLHYDDMKITKLIETKRKEHFGFINDYDWIRLKAYRTKTREIRNRLIELIKQGGNK